MTDRSPAQRRSQRMPLTPARLLLLVLVLAAAWLIQKYGEPPPQQEARRPVPVDVAVERDRPDERDRPGEPAETKQQPESRSRPTASKSTAESRRQIENATIRDADGQVVYRGAVDVGATLDRIAAGQLLDYRNDGSTFENRERRLPRKPSGYYKEYVHPTPGLSGPGPQRIVTGAGGEAYYTPDHYRTFKKLR